jgi:hypothetical protein
MQHIKLFEQFIAEFSMAEPTVKPAPVKEPSTRPSTRPKPGPVPSKQPFKQPEPAKAQADDVITRLKRLESNEEL